MSEMLLLRLLHVVAGVLWAGTAVFLPVYVFPAIRETGPAGGAVMGSLLRRKLMVVLPAMAMVTILSGFTLAWRLGGNDLAAYARSGPGRIFTMAGGLAVIAFLVGFFIARPAGTRAGRLAARLATLPDGPDKATTAAMLAALQRRTAVAGNIIAILVLAATVGMAIARYAG